MYRTIPWLIRALNFGPAFDAFTAALYTINLGYSNPRAEQIILKVLETRISLFSGTYSGYPAPINSFEEFWKAVIRIHTPENEAIWISVTELYRLIMERKGSGETKYKEEGEVELLLPFLRFTIRELARKTSTLRPLSLQEKLTLLSVTAQRELGTPPQQLLNILSGGTPSLLDRCRELTQTTEERISSGVDRLADQTLKVNENMPEYAAIMLRRLHSR